MTRVALAGHRARILAVGIAAWIAVVGLAWGRDSYYAAQAGSASLAFGVLLVLVLTPVWILYLWRSRKLRPTALLEASAWLVVVTAPFGGIFLSTSIALGRNAREVADQRARCEELIPRLEAHRRMTGFYPGPDQVDSSCYVRDREGLRYRLGFSEEAEGLSGYPLHLYDSQRGCWMSFDSTWDWGFVPDQLDNWASPQR